MKFNFICDNIKLQTKLNKTEWRENMDNENISALLEAFRDLTPKSQMYVLNMVNLAKASEDAIKEELKNKKKGEIICNK